jgi:hypothetical protein
MDIAKGIFNLGKDLAANGANFGAAGTWLAGIGDGFLAWSKSASARRDVQGFMKFLHDEGPVVKGILKDLGTILPGIFAGATTIGTLELQALGDFLHLVANLPKGWQKPLTEFAGAMLLLSKIGVVKVGLKFVGLEALAAALPAAAGPMAAAGAAMAAGVVLKFREDLKNSIPALGHDLANVFTGLGGFAATGAAGLADMIASHFEKPVRAGWAALGRYLAASAARTWHDIMDSLHALAGDARATWDMIWRNTVTRTQHGIHDVVGWFHTLSGRAIDALFGLGHRLAAFASAAMGEMWNGIKRVGANIVGWFGGFVSKIVGFFSRLLHHSPTGDFYHMGRNMMEGLAMGLKDHAHLVANAASGVSGALGGDALANQALARRIFPWGAAQWPSFVSLVMAESGFNRFARNPSSGAYGIPQALPPSKLPFAGQAAGGSHAGPQLGWMFNYIAGRYGTPANAWAHEVASHWYGSGFHGWFSKPTLIGVGERGRERVDIFPAQAGTGRGGGGTVTVRFDFSGSHNHQLADIIRQAVRVQGGGDVQIALGSSH